MIMVNTPHNPVGKVFTRQELEGIAALAEEFNLLVMADEVVSLASYRLPQLCPNIAISMTVWCSTTRNTFALRRSLECGIEQ